MSITLYSTDCPRCKILEGVLTQHGVPFEIVKDEDIIMEVADKHGINTAPFLELNNGEILTYPDAMAYFDDRGGLVPQ